MDYSEQYDKIYRYCYFRVQNRDLAEDITQEAFLRFLKHEEYQGKGKELQYLYTIARNLCIDEYRKMALVQMYSEDTCVQKTCFYWENDMLETLAMKLALEKLTPKERELVLLRYVNEVPVNAICEFEKCSRFALHRRLKQIVKKLRQYLAEGGDADVT